MEKIAKGQPVKGSWRTAMDYTYLGAEDLEDGQEQTLIIKEVTNDVVPNMRTKMPEPVVVLSFDGIERRMISNATNCRVLARMAGSNRCSKWIGLRVTLYKEHGSWFKGSVTEALRLKPAMKSEKPK